MNYHDDNFAQQIEKLDKNTPIYVYCKFGRRSSGAADILKESDLKKSIILTEVLLLGKKMGLR